MDKIVNFQLSMFGSFINIKPNTEITMLLMKNLADESMVPGTATVSSIDPVNRKIDTETRLQIMSQDKCWKIVFFEERIDVTYDFVGGDIFYSSFDDVFRKGIDILTKTFNTFSGTTGNRLAVNAKVLLPAMDADSENAFIRKFSTPVSVFEKECLNEWNLQYNVRKRITISKDKTETCNNIVNMGLLVGIDAKTGVLHRRIFVGMDINTSPDKSELRFNYNDLVSFAKEVKGEMESILASVEGV